MLEGTQSRQYYFPTYKITFKTGWKPENTVRPLAPTLWTLKSGRLIEVGRLTEYNINWIGNAVNMILFPLYRQML